jgi:cobalt-zinc-cadmium efflux system membrane fusion protein
VSAQLGDRVATGDVLALLDSIELGQAKAAYLVSKATEEVARENHEREQRLFADRISSEKEMLEARGSFLQAAASRQSAEETLHLYGLEDEEIAALRPGELGASLLSVRAPFAGLVVEQHVTVGELVTPEDNLFTIADLGHVWIWLDVYEQDLGKVHLGDEVSVEVAAYPGRAFTGTVTYAGSKVAADTRTVRARLDVTNPEGLLRPGMFARVQLTDPHAQGAASALVVPDTAVQRDGTKFLVFVPVGEGRFARREIEVGRHEGRWIEVRSGLVRGESVVTAGVFLLKSELSSGELGGGHSH